MILKITLMPQIKEAFFWSKVNTKSTLQYPFEVYSDVSFIHIIFSRNWHFFICAYFINFRFNVCVLAGLITGICSTWYFEDLFSYHEWKQLFTQKCATNYQTYLENQMNNFWIWNNSMLMKYHTGDSAEWINIIWAQFRGQVLGTPRLTALKLLPETVFSSDHNNLKRAILGT
jgi:hypothetical protein